MSNFTCSGCSSVIDFAVSFSVNCILVKCASSPTNTPIKNSLKCVKLLWSTVIQSITTKWSSASVCLIPNAWTDVSFPRLHMTVSYIWLKDLPAVVRQSSSSLLSWQLSWPLHKKLRSTQWPFRHLKRASEHTSGLPAVVESGQRWSVKC